MRVFAQLFLTTAFLLTASLGAFAQAIPARERPGREEQRFATPEAARARPAGVAIKLPEMIEPAGAATTPIIIKGIVIEGATVYSNADLEPLYAGIVGRQTNVAAIFDIARKITAKYGAAGYVLSRAIVPPQPLNPKGAAVHLRVIEGFVDKVMDCTPKLRHAKTVTWPSEEGLCQINHSVHSRRSSRSS